MKKTIDLSNVDYYKCPPWYQNMIQAYIKKHGGLAAAATMGVTHLKNVFVEISGADIQFEYDPCTAYRTIEGEESEIMMMILKWS